MGISKDDLVPYYIIHYTTLFVFCQGEIGMNLYEIVGFDSKKHKIHGQVFLDGVGIESNEYDDILWIMSDTDLDAIFSGNFVGRKLLVIAMTDYKRDLALSQLGF